MLLYLGVFMVYMAKYSCSAQGERTERSGGFGEDTPRESPTRWHEGHVVALRRLSNGILGSSKMQSSQEGVSPRVGRS